MERSWCFPVNPNVTHLRFVTTYGDSRGMELCEGPLPHVSSYTINKQIKVTNSPRIASIASSENAHM